MQLSSASPALGVRVEGIDVVGASDDLIGALREQLNRHHVVVVANQNLPRGAMQAFGERWGELMTHPSGMDADYPFVQILASRTPRKGKAFSAWHSDMSWHPTPPWITMLHARELPSVGGDTGYANQHAAWEHLDQAGKDRRRVFRRNLPGASQLRSLHALHTGKGFGPDVPDSVHPIVRTHDETGREALYVNPEFTSHIVELDEVESQLLLWPLWAHQVNLEFTYRHRWAPGDLVIWDNRSVMHTAILDYDEPRRMSRVVVKGKPPR